jgi:hypothetical protein
MYIDMSQTTKNFMIIGHGHLKTNEAGNINTFKSNNMNVFTFAGPTSRCIYSPLLLSRLRKALKKEHSKMNSFDNFHKTILRVEKEEIGKNYCSEEWAKMVGHIEEYEVKNSCTTQQNNIQDKQFSFMNTDPRVPVDVVGIWELETGTNILSPEVLSSAIFERLYSIGLELSFKNVSQIIRKVFGNDVEINILDCSCGAVYDENEEKINDARSVRRFNRELTTIFKSIAKNKTLRTKSTLRSSRNSKSSVNGTRKHSVKSASVKSAK